ncbi:hypothetical protein AND_009753 [Anopheles darlingi]|uniref:Uncharacterized protein n=1 Tax=Anopheles darlingi TaxID=43151 RepID=W5J480_ANODA|nr:hypothetical protein AND_009753 [Anopheles darlingi]
MLRKDLQTIEMNIKDANEYAAQKAAKDTSPDGTASSAKKTRPVGKRSNGSSPRQEKKMALNKTFLDQQIRYLYHRTLALNERTGSELAKAESCGILEAIQPTSTTPQFDNVELPPA